ncbi:hypothetical protein H7Y40_01910, partial [Pedobacter sp.]|nr:hypothetical protein [Candidatus Saccharibacteria bacterium]
MSHTLFDVVGLDWLRSHKTKAVYKEACQRYDLIYFGSVNQQTDEHEMVRGVTLSNTHRDTHYCVGSIQGWDAILLERTDTIIFPGKPTKEYRWNILQIDLKTAQLPHILLDAHHHNETFYAQLFTKFIRLTRADVNIFTDQDSPFNKRYSVYTPPDSLDTLPLLFPPDTTSVLGHHFAQFDYECFQDRLLIYAPDHVP